MAKMTKDNLVTFVKGYVNSEKSAGTWTGSVDDFTKMAEKIGSQVTLDGNWNDKLAGLFEGETLPYGKTVEEYFVDLILPVDYKDGVTYEDSFETYMPTFEQAAYSYTLGRKKLPLVQSYDSIEKVANDGEALATIEASIMSKFAASYTNARYSVKEEALGNLYGKAKAVTDSNMVQTLAKPIDTETGEAFIEAIKKAVEVASDRNTKNCLSGELIGAAPSLVLVVNQGIIPSLDVNTLAGAFNQERLALGVEVKAVDSLGSTADADGVYAILVDPRTVQVRNSYNAVRTDMDANLDKVRFVHHFEDTVFTSKYTFVRAFKNA